nr:hypothetical protein [uncultured Brachyspira sp.]
MPARIEIKIPITEQITDIIAEQIVTERKLLNICIDDKAGNIIKAEINNEPTRFIANTMTTAIITAINKL